VNIQAAAYFLKLARVGRNSSASSGEHAAFKLAVLLNRHLDLISKIDGTANEGLRDLILAAGNGGYIVVSDMVEKFNSPEI